MIRNFQQLKHALYRLKAKLLYRSRAGAIVRSSVWRELPRGKELVVLFKETKEVFKGYGPMQIKDPVLTERFAAENTCWNFQDDVIYEVRKEVLLEPKLSLAFAKPNYFIAQTKSKVHHHVVPAFRYAFAPAPKAVKKYKALVHCDGYAGKNLFHFIDDALNPLLLLYRAGQVPADVQVLIHEQVFELPYVQYFLQQLPSLQHCKWVVQEKEQWIGADLLYKSVASQAHWKVLYGELAALHRKNPHRRIFLNRKQQHQRTIRNYKELEPILAQYGFETIYAEDLTYREQVTLFNDVQYLIGIHGAGITNLIHSDIKKVSLLELFSADLVQPHYYWVFQQMDLFFYDGIIGSQFDVNWNYTIDAITFSNRVAAMMAHS